MSSLCTISETGRDSTVDVLELVRYVPTHLLPVSPCGTAASAAPVLLAGTLLDDPADLPESGVALDEDVHVAETPAIHEGEPFIGEGVAEILDVLHFAEEGLVVSHIRFVLFPDTKIGLINETYVRVIDGKG